ncbi:NAD-dependent epimerase/dehydratase family protein [Marinobacter confluentis]|uniref:NAD-dependent epimerase/dehydratase family protein n=1 Tax=Marinobacter confluentis TaxID=1697557 RepID=A0A4Z1C5S7_9GAMM|nr:NAD-dependent epimerase/dehydratase family protein [Marinobacter confluentis]TGN40690.1 NAD-dependent epimerase/dehydratase family protein [Marinobacter confluentis]
MKNILVFGGTGAMGKHLVQLLAELGHSVSVTTRTARKATANIEYIQGNAKDDSFVDLILARKWDAIVDFMMYPTLVFEQRAPKLLAATDQYIYLSSARVYADSAEPIQEDSPRLLDSSNDSEFLVTDEYSLAKARQENMLRQSGRDNWTIVRPYITYSEQRLQLGVLEKEGWLYRALKGRTIVFSEDIVAKLTTLTYGFDVADAITKLIGEPRALGETYHITQREAVTWHEVLNVYLNVLEKLLGKRPKVLLLGLDDFSRCTRAEYQVKYDRLFKRTFNSSKIAEYVDVKDFFPLEQGLTRCLEEFLENPQFLAIDWRSEAIKDRYSGEVASLTEPGHLKQKLKYFIYRFIKS